MPTNPLEFGRKGLQGRDPNYFPMFGNEPSALAALVVTAEVEPRAKPPKKNRKPPKKNRKKGGTEPPQ